MKQPGLQRQCPGENFPTLRGYASLHPACTLVEPDKRGYLAVISIRNALCYRYPPFMHDGVQCRFNPFAVPISVTNVVHVMWSKFFERFSGDPQFQYLVAARKP